MEVLGRDRMREAYKVRVDLDGRTIEAWVPESLMAADIRPDGPRHQGAYEWLAAHRNAVRRALSDLSRGVSPAAPYHLIDLPEES